MVSGKHPIERLRRSSYWAPRACSLADLRFGLVHHHAAGFHDPTHIVDGHVDVCQRVAFDGDEVREIAVSHPHGVLM